MFRKVGSMPVALGVMGLLWAGCGGGDPVVELVSPIDGATVCGDPLSIEVAVENFTIIADSDEHEHEKALAKHTPLHEEGGENEGHVHVYIDGAYVYQGNADAFDLETPIADGEHQLKVDLVNADHTPVEPYTSDLVYITVDNALCAP